MWRQPRFSMKIVCSLQWSVLHERRTRFAVYFIILALTRVTLHYLCVTLNDYGSMLTLRPELSNLDACEVREMPLTWRATTGALAYLSLFIIVRIKGQGQVTASTGACGCTSIHTNMGRTLTVFLSSWKWWSMWWKTTNRLIGCNSCELLRLVLTKALPGLLRSGSQRPFRQAATEALLWRIPEKGGAPQPSIRDNTVLDPSQQRPLPSKDHFLIGTSGCHYLRVTSVIFICRISVNESTLHIASLWKRSVSSWNQEGTGWENRQSFLQCDQSWHLVCF